MHRRAEKLADRFNLASVHRLAQGQRMGCSDRTSLPLHIRDGSVSDPGLGDILVTIVITWTTIRNCPSGSGSPTQYSAGIGPPGMSGALGCLPADGAGHFFHLFWDRHAPLAGLSQAILYWNI
jgi:hypothetical protein